MAPVIDISGTLHSTSMKIMEGGERRVAPSVVATEDGLAGNTAKSSFDSRD